MRFFKRKYFDEKNKNILNKNIEKALFLLSFIFLSILIISQIGLMNNATRTFFTDIDSYEGIDINDVSNMTNYGQLKLKLIGIEPNSNIKVLVNGYEKYVFDKEIISIAVKNNSLIEIDGTKMKKPFSVKIINVSSNIASNLKSKKISVSSNIEILARIFLK